jgi:hypothetical protein
MYDETHSRQLSESDSTAVISIEFLNPCLYTEKFPFFVKDVGFHTLQCWYPTLSQFPTLSYPKIPSPRFYLAVFIEGPGAHNLPQLSVRICKHDKIGEHDLHVISHILIFNTWSKVDHQPTSLQDPL